MMNHTLHNIVIPILILIKLTFQIDFSRYTKCEADIIIGGIFPIRIQHSHDHHYNNDVSKCEGRLSPTGLQEALAFIYAVHKINKEKSLLSNCTLGIDLATSCDSNELAIKSVLQFDFIREKLTESIYTNEATVKTRPQGILPMDKRLPIKTVAVIGLGKSSISDSVATMTNLFSVPTISYGSTAPSLSNRKRFRTFARTIPNDELMIKAIISLIEKLQWNIVFAVLDNTDYAISIFSLFQKHLEAGNTSYKICIAEQFDYSTLFDNDHLNETLSRFPYSKGFILFVHKERATEIIMKASERGIKNYVWIFSGIELTTTFKKMLQTSTRQNTLISLQPRSFEFDKSNPVYKDFMEFTETHFFDPTLSQLIPDLKECISNRCMLEAPSLSFLVPYVIDGVKAIAYALNKSNISCDKKNVTDLRLEMKSLLNVTFESVLGYDFKFTEGGNVNGEYDVLLLQEPSSLFQRAAIWKDNTIQNVTESLLRIIPRSSCDKTCSIGQGLTIQQNQPECCTGCAPCNENEYTDQSTKRCKQCKKFYKPTKNRTQCEVLHEERIEYSSPAGIIMITCAVLGQTSALLIIATFIKYRQTHVVRASSWEISITMLIGAFLCFASPYAIIGHMTDLKCQLHMVGSGISLSLMIGALFVKTNRIYRIFSKKVMRKGLPRFLGRGWQFTILFCITISDVLISTIVTFNPNDPVRHDQVVSGVNQFKKMYSTCHYSKGAVGGWWIFHCSLVFTCTYQAVVSRHVPGNYKEARNIMLAMLAITLEMLFVLPGFYYYDSQTGFYRQIILALVNIVSACSTIICLFLPKLYIIFCRPSENKETLPHGTLGTFMKIDSTHQDSPVIKPGKHQDSPVIKQGKYQDSPVIKPAKHQDSVKKKDKNKIYSGQVTSKKPFETPSMINSTNKLKQLTDGLKSTQGRNENGEISIKRRKIIAKTSTQEGNENREISINRRKILAKTLTTSIRRRKIRGKEYIMKTSSSYPELGNIAVISKKFKSLDSNLQLVD